MSVQSSTSKTPQQITDLLKKIMRKTQQSISCAELAIIESIDSSKAIGKYKCSLMNNMNIVVSCEICSHVSNVSEGSIVLIVFCDSDFRANLEKINRGTTRSVTNVSNELHSASYGVIVGKLS